MPGCRDGRATDGLPLSARDSTRLFGSTSRRSSAESKSRVSLLALVPRSDSQVLCSIGGRHGSLEVVFDVALANARRRITTKAAYSCLCSNLTESREMNLSASTTRD